MKVIEEITARRSMRAYTPQPVEREKLDRILEAGRLAPTARNQQDWRILIVSEKQLKDRLVDEASPHQLFLKQAPLILAACALNPDYVMRCGHPAFLIDLAIVLEHIALQARRYDSWVMSDEIYARIAYDGLRVSSIASLPGMQERTIIVDGFSKTYSMTGWRLGYGIMPHDLAARVDLLLTHSIGSTAHFTQFAGLEAINGPQEMVQVMVSEYQRRRDVIVAGLNAIPGITCQKPQGAFYAFPNITGTGFSSGDLADLLLEQAGVALLPGTSFGKHGEGYLRLSYANSIENIEKGLRQIQAVLAG